MVVLKPVPGKILEFPTEDGGEKYATAPPKITVVYPQALLMSWGDIRPN